MIGCPENESTCADLTAKCHVQYSLEKLHLPGCDNASGVDYVSVCSAVGADGHNHSGLRRLVFIYAAFRWALMFRMIRKRNAERLLESVHDALGVLALVGLDLPFQPSCLAHSNESIINSWMAVYEGIEQSRSIGIPTPSNFTEEFPDADLMAFLRYCASSQPYWGGTFVPFAGGELSVFTSSTMGIDTFFDFFKIRYAD